MLEVYVDDFIGITIPTSQQHLDHVANAVMYSIHDVFLAHKDPALDPISHKKLEKQDGQWANIKEILGMLFDGIQKTIWLSSYKRFALLTTLRQWIRLSSN